MAIPRKNMTFNVTDGYWEGTFSAGALGTHQFGIEGLKIPLLGEYVDDSVATFGLVKYSDLLSGSEIAPTATPWSSPPSMNSHTFSRDACASDVHAFCVENTGFLVTTEDGFRTSSVIDLKLALSGLTTDLSSVKCVDVAHGLDEIVVLTNVGVYIVPAAYVVSSDSGLGSWAEAKHRTASPFAGVLGDGASISSFDAIRGQDACVEVCRL